MKYFGYICKKMKMELNIETVKTIARNAALSALELAGVNPVLSYSQASAKYGKFFKDMVCEGRIHPRYSGKGATGKREYAIKDILLLMEAESAPAKLKG